MNKPIRKKVVVIGGGYTGMVAALRLAEAGHTVTIVERAQTLGGLASDFKIEGASLERAYHHLFKTDKSIINLAEELGVGNKLKWHDSSLSIYYGGALYPFMTPLDLLKFTPLSLVNRVRAGVVALYLQKTKNWKALEQTSAHAWMRKAAGKQVSDVIWEPLLRGKFDAYYDKVAMSWLWARIHTRGNSKEKGETTEKLGYFEGGFQIFTDALMKKLQELGVEMHTGAMISEITSLPSKRVRVTFEKGPAKLFDAAIATTPSHVFAALTKNNKLPKKYLSQLSSINYLGAALMIFSSDQDLSPYYWHNINDIDLPFLVFINHTKLVGTEHYKGKHVYYIGAYLSHEHPLFNASDKELADTWLTALKKIFPAFDRKKIHEQHIFRFKNAQHIVDADYSKKIPNYKTPLPNIYLANFSQIYPEDRGTNFAVREGEKIARLLLEDK